MIDYVVSTMRVWRERRRSQETLLRLSDWQLRDLGFYRPAPHEAPRRLVDAA